MKWEKKTLSELALEGLLVDGDWIESKDQDPNGDIRLIQLADIGDNLFINKSKKFINKETSKKLNCTFLQQGDILIARMPDPIGRACIFPLPESKSYITAVDVCILRVGLKINNRYAMYAINSPSFRRKIQGLITGTTRQRISRSKLTELKIPLPPLPIQQQIADSLDKADALRRKDQELLDKYDELAQAVFYEMFGDPEENPKGWEKRPLEYGVKLQGGFAFKSNDIKNSGIKLVKISNVGFEKILWDSIEYLPIEFSLKYADFLLHDGDIVMALTRPIIKSLDTIKVAQITKNDTPCLLNQRVARVSVNANIATGIYLLYFFYTQYFKKKVEKFCSTSLQPNISTSQIESIETPFPPLRLQKIFEAKISHILESKRKLSNVLTEELFNKAIEICFKY